MYTAFIKSTKHPQKQSNKKEEFRKSPRFPTLKWHWNTKKFVPRKSRLWKSRRSLHFWFLIQKEGVRSPFRIIRTFTLAVYLYTPARTYTVRIRGSRRNKLARTFRHAVGHINILRFFAFARRRSAKWKTGRGNDVSYLVPAFQVSG